MLRKWLSLLLAAVMLMSLVPLASAETEAGIYRLVRRTDSGLETVGMAALVDQSGAVLLTSADAASDISGLFAVGADGTIAITSASYGQGHVARLVLARSSTLAPLTLSSASPATYTAQRADGSTISSRADGVVSCSYDGLDAVSVTLCDGALPGSLLFSSDGKLVGMAVAASNEGFGRYTCLTAASLYNELLALTYGFENDAGPAEENDDTAASSDGKQPVITGVENGFMYVDLSAMEAAQGRELKLCYADASNTYYLSAEKQADGSFACVVQPGRTYGLWVYPADEQPSVSANNYSLIYTVPEADTYSGYSFQPGECYVALGDASLSNDTLGLLEGPVTSVSLSALTSQRLYLCVSSTYEIGDEDVEVPAQLVLVFPNGGCLSLTSAYTFGKQYLPLDAWHNDITEVLNYAVSKLGTGDGTYTVRYYIAGQPAAECSFELTSGDTASAGTPAESSSGDSAEEASPEMKITVTDQYKAHVDISALASEGEQWFAAIQPEGMDYTVSFGFDGTAMDIALVPGRTCYIGVGKGDYQNWSSGQILAIEKITCEDLGDYTDYDFADAGSYVTIVPDGQEAQPMDEITVKDLSSGRLTVSVSSTYQVTEDVELPAMSVLADEDGHFVMEYSSYTFSRQYMPVDSWTEDLTNMAGTIVNAQGGKALKAGTYTYNYYIAGKKAVEVVFTLKDEAQPEATAAPEAVTAPASLNVSYMSGVMTVDFSAFAKDSADYSVAVRDSGNAYLSTFKPRAGETSVQLRAVPGRDYAICLLDSADQKVTGSETTFSVPAAGAFTDYGYAEHDAYITLAEESAILNDGSQLPTADDLTVTEINNGKHLALVCTSTYSVTGDISYPCTVSLITPDGSCLTDNMNPAFTLETSLQAGDTWQIDLTSAFASSISYTRDGGWVSGPYTLAWYFNGQLAGRTSFLIR